MNVINAQIIKLVKDCRRHIHSYPEKGWMEYATAAFICSHLSENGFVIKRGDELMNMSFAFGLPSSKENSIAYSKAIKLFPEADLSCFKDNKTALSAFLDRGSDKTVAFRFDMDALPICESDSPNHFPSIEHFVSTNVGVMHSCAHDMHAALGIGLAKLVADNKDELNVNVLLIFQPAEEGVRGALSIVNSSCLDKVDYLISSHLWANMPLGKIVCSQNGIFSTHKFDVIIKGKSVHAGICPEKGCNALLAAANIIVDLHSLPSEFNELVRVNVGKVEAGSARNIVADNAKLEVELRAKYYETELTLMGRARSIIKKDCDLQNCSFEIIMQGEAAGAMGSQDLSQIIEKEAYEIPFFHNIIVSDDVNRGCEDFSTMMNCVIKNGGKACFMGIGASLEAMDLAHHTPDFDVSEEVIAPVLELYFGLITKIGS